MSQRLLRLAAAHLNIPKVFFDFAPGQVPHLKSCVRKLLKSLCHLLGSARSSRRCLGWCRRTLGQGPYPNAVVDVCRCPSSTVNAPSGAELFVELCFLRMEALPAQCGRLHSGQRARVVRSPSGLATQPVPQSSQSSQKSQATSYATTRAGLEKKNQANVLTFEAATLGRSLIQKLLSIRAGELLGTPKLCSSRGP